MGLEHARNILNNRGDLAFCSSLSLAILSPRELEDDILKASLGNRGEIISLAAILKNELVKMATYL